MLPRRSDVVKAPCEAWTGTPREIFARDLTVSREPQPGSEPWTCFWRTVRRQSDSVVVASVPTDRFLTGKSGDTVFVQCCCFKRAPSTATPSLAGRRVLYAPGGSLNEGQVLSVGGRDSVEGVAVMIDQWGWGHCGERTHLPADILVANNGLTV